MSTVLTATDPNYGTPIELGVADGVIAGLQGRLADLTADTPAGYQAVKSGIAEVRTIRVNVEKSRKDLKQSALDWGRKVDTEAKRVTAKLLEIEKPLKERKALVDQAAERKRQEKVEAICKAQEEKERFERKQREIAESAERERIKKEQEVERAKLAVERVELETLRAQQREWERLEQEKMAAERKELEVEKAKVEAEKHKQEEAKRKEQEERDRIAREKEEAALRKEREEKEASDRKAQAKRDAKIAEQRKPDREKLRDFATLLSEMPLPEMKTDWGQEALDEIGNGLGAVIQGIDSRTAGA